MSARFGIDYENDWAGECRNDPSLGNAYVLRSIERWSTGQIVVHINDIMGGHAATITVDEWLTWEKCP